MALLTRFNLRRDLVNRKLHNSFTGTVYTTKIHATNHAIARNYVNSILYHLNKLYSNPNNCSCLTKAELEEIITKTINVKIIDVSKLEEISKSINDAKTSINEAVYLLKDEELSLCKVIHESIDILTDLNQTIKTTSSDIEKKYEESLLRIETSTQNTLDSINDLSASVNTFKQTVDNALQSIDEEKQKAIEAISSNNVDDIKEELLEKINYIFQMFYHGDSDDIIKNFPLQLIV